MITLLDATPKTMTQTSEEAEMYKSHTSEAIKELEKKGLMECLTPDRFYQSVCEGAVPLEGAVFSGGSSLALPSQTEPSSLASSLCSSLLVNT
ncbi:hypothetical protein AKJ65_05840 [candidate division MSBL1 archaeon SCGC-AAA259E19]|nr:hypothetical protein AKJ65_05840 [candidate division MSBL1 archaeon SCGC-AAA259E19]